ncbi:MAG: hypothetical protein P4L91_09525 [Burkholderiaceae bacterium]|nr:hypothetical protein [Burkholderiaceae bacterium]
MEPWDSYKVKPAGFIPSNTINNACREFTVVTHTSHVESALGIINAREIKPGLVYDKSILNTERILVSWLSPNHWHPGYRYGNIQFEFDFFKISQGKNFYWVEVIDYSPHACRILITDKSHDGQLQRYDPLKGNGPWWYDERSNKHFFNGDFCLEFMIEAPVELSKLTSFSFVDHHGGMCSAHKNNIGACDQLGLSASAGGALFFARAIATGVDLSGLATFLVKPDGKAGIYLQAAYEHLLYKAYRPPPGFQFSGSLDEWSSDILLTHARSFIAAYAYGRQDDAKHYHGLFKSEYVFRDAIAAVVAESLKINWRRLFEDTI